MVNYKYISLPIQLASAALLDSMDTELQNNSILVCYAIYRGILGFSAIESSEDIELMCKSEEEFLSKVNQHRLLRML